jgi:hypothetical protein
VQDPVVLVYLGHVPVVVGLDALHSLGWSPSVVIHGAVCE